MEGELAAFSGRWLAIMVTMCLQPPRGDWVSQLSRQLVTNLKFVSTTNSSNSIHRWGGKNVGVLAITWGSCYVQFGGKINSSKNKQQGRMIGVIVKFVIVWLWWVAMPIALHHWIYKRCRSWNLKRWRTSKKLGRVSSCFNVRLQRVPCVSAAYESRCPDDREEIINLQVHSPANF